MGKQVVTNVEQIFEQGNLHMSTKLKHFGSQGQKVVKYIISKLRKYHGEFFESNSTIAEATGVSVRTVQNTVKRAEQLEIFVVSSRSESTFNGKMRQTSNKIQLLSYEAVEVVKEVIEEVRTVASKVAKKAIKTVKKVFTPKAPKNESKGNYKPYNNTYKSNRTEIVPEWINKPYVEPVKTEEEKAAFEKRRAELQAKLREKYGK